MPSRAHTRYTLIHRAGKSSSNKKRIIEMFTTVASTELLTTSKTVANNQILIHYWLVAELHCRLVGLSFGKFEFPQESSLRADILTQNHLTLKTYRENGSPRQLNLWQELESQPTTPHSDTINCRANYVLNMHTAGSFLYLRFNRMVLAYIYIYI